MNATQAVSTGQGLFVSGASCLLLAIGPINAVGASSDCVMIDDFANAQVGEFPANWQVRTDNGRNVYRVTRESNVPFLRGSAQGLGVQAGRQYVWDLDEYPVVAWSWRPRTFPKAADERVPQANDSALAVYVLVPYSRLVGPKTVKYIWSERVPAGTRLSSNFGLTQVRVLRSGLPLAQDQWVQERVNARDDIKSYFNLRETPKPGGIAVLTDSDDTESSAEGDYASFRVCRQ